MNGGLGGGYKLFFLEVLLFRSYNRELKTFVAKFGGNWLLWLRNMTSKELRFRPF